MEITIQRQEVREVINNEEIFSEIVYINGKLTKENFENVYSRLELSGYEITVLPDLEGFDDLTELIN